MKQHRIALVTCLTAATTAIILLCAAGAVAETPGTIPESASSGTTVSLPAEQEAWVSSAQNSTNFGGLGYVWVGRGKGSGSVTGALRAYTWFDVSGIPVNARIVDANLVATIWDDQGPDDHFHYCAVRPFTSWDESSVSWNDQPGTTSGGSCLDISASGGQVSWDVTNSVQYFHDGSWENYGLGLMPNSMTNPIRRRMRGCSATSCFR